MDDDELPEQYFCEQCRPDLHQGLLEKVERGERPWEERERQRQQEEEAKRVRNKRGKKGKKGRSSNVKAETKPETEPAPEPESAKINGEPDDASIAMPPPTPVEPEPRVESVAKRKYANNTTEEVQSPSQQVGHFLQYGIEHG